MFDLNITESAKWFKEAKFGMMVHFGLYSILGGEYKGKRISNIGEWAMHTCRIPVKEYEKIATAFNPIYFNAYEWVRTAKNAGMKYIVVTSKHHEGFCLFNSAVDNYNSVKGTPFSRDIIGELAEACAKHGVKPGLYYSQCLDWHEQNGGGYTVPQEHENDPNGGSMWGNDWDFTDNSKKNYKLCFENKIKPQVEELMKNYGEISLVWFDTPMEEQTREQSLELYELVRKYQPGCLVNSRIGNGIGDYHSCGDNMLPEHYTEKLIEAPVTLARRTWGYKTFDSDCKSADTVCEILSKCNSKGCNLLLNVGPDWLGRIPAPSVEVLSEVGKKILL